MIIVSCLRTFRLVLFYMNSTLTNFDTSLFTDCQSSMTKTSNFITAEIERFESVHPSIYCIYEIIDEMKDQLTNLTKIREHVMIIEGIEMENIEIHIL